MLSALRMLSKLSTYLRRQHHKNVKKGTIRIERKFAEDWMEMVQVTTVRREDATCKEVFSRVMEEEKDDQEEVLEGEEIV